MAYFAQIENDVVVNVIIADSLEWVNDNLEGTWLETKEDGSIRYNYAGVGYTYDPIDDAFIEAIPNCGHESLLLNDLKRWECAACEALAMQSRTTA
jgi:hypothetical protein